MSCQYSHIVSAELTRLCLVILVRQHSAQQVIILPDTAKIQTELSE